VRSEFHLLEMAEEPNRQLTFRREQEREAELLRERNDSEAARMDKERERAEREKHLDPEARHAERMERYHRSWLKDVELLKTKHRQTEVAACATAAFWFAQRGQASIERELDSVFDQLGNAKKNFDAVAKVLKNDRKNFKTVDAALKGHRAWIKELEERIARLEANNPQAE
jgi:hypothetical protein